MLERADGAEPGSFAAVGGAPDRRPSYTDTAVTAGASYSYRVAAVNGERHRHVQRRRERHRSRRQGRDAHRQHHGRTGRCFADTIYTLSGLREGDQRRDAHDPGRAPRSSATRRAGQLALDPPRRQDRRGGHRRRARSSSPRRKPAGQRAAGRLGRDHHHRQRHHQPDAAPCSPRVRQGDHRELLGRHRQRRQQRHAALRPHRVRRLRRLRRAPARSSTPSRSTRSGSGTTLEYVQTLAGLDDSFEWWGGAVDGRYLVSYESGDDHFDWTEGYRGRNQFLIALPEAPGSTRRRAPACSRPIREGFEADGCNGTGCDLGLRQPQPLLGAGVRELHPDRPGHRHDAHRRRATTAWCCAAAPAAT